MKNKDTQLLEEAYENVKKQNLSSTIFGDRDRPATKGFLGFFKKWEEKLFLYDPKTGAPRFNQQVIKEELKKIGLTDEEIENIRNKTIAAAKSAQQEIFQKYPDALRSQTVISNAKNPESFQIYNVFSFDNNAEFVLEFNRLFRRKLEMLLQNIK